MKRIVSFICTVAILSAMLIPMFSSVQVSAAETPWYKGWTAVAGSPYITEDGTVRIPNGGQYQWSYSGRPNRYSFEFSMNVITWSNSIGLQGMADGYRVGGYIRDGHIAGMTDGMGRLPIENGITGWHDYKFEVDHDNKTQKVYYDGLYVGTHPLISTGHGGDIFYFWAQSGAEIEIDAVKFTALTGTEDGGEKAPLSVKEGEYTQAYFEDFDTLDNVVLSGEDYITHDKENGILSLFTDEVMRSNTWVDKPLNPPKNFDIEFRLRAPVVDAVNEDGIPKAPGTFNVEVSTGDRHTWLSIASNYIEIRAHGEQWSDAFYEGAIEGVSHHLERGVWFTLKGEFRDRRVTWYIDDKELMEYECYKANNNVWHTAIGYSWPYYYTGGVDIDWQRYTPYFDEELTMVAPATNSQIAAGSDISIKAETTLETEKIDYYLNGVYIGSGYKQSDYVYNLEKVKVGSYHLTAKVGEIETCETKFEVKKAYDAKLALDSDRIRCGDTVKAVAEIDSLYDSYKPTVAEFFVNGQLYFTDSLAPFEANFSELRVGTNVISAKLYDSSGFGVQCEPKTVDVDYVAGAKFEIGREYELNYNYNAGNGNIHLNDGYFDLSVTNNKDSVTYMTDEGAKTYNNTGYGDYKVVVSAGHAEIYWKGQFLESIRLPYKPGKAEFTYSGIVDVNLSGSGVKTEIFSKKWDGEANYDSGVLPMNQNYYYSVEFDKTDSSTEKIYINDGRYNSTLYFREDGIYVRREGGRAEEPTELKLTDEVKPGYYRVTVSYGIAQLTLNNVPIGHYRSVEVGSRAEVKRTMTNPGASTFIAVKNSDDVYYHRDDFENTSEFPSEEYWQEGPTSFRTAASENLVVDRKAEGANHYMSLDGSGVYVLNATDKYPNLKWRGRVDKAEGKVFAVLRQAQCFHHAKIGYDFDKDGWFFEIHTREGKFIEQETKSAPNALQTNKWYDFEVKTDDFYVSLLVDGVEVFKKELNYDFNTIYYGRFGVGVLGSAFSIDDFEYIGQNRVTPGARYFVPLQFLGQDIGAYPAENSYTYLSDVGTFFEDKEDGAVYAITGAAANSNLVTRDNGKTWEKANGGPFGYTVNSYGTMPDGTMVGALRGQSSMGKPQYSMISKDGGKTWSEPYLIHDGTYGHLGTGERMCVTSKGRALLVFESGTEGFGIMSVFYSDDGINWKISENEYITEHETGCVMNEPIVVETPRENELWLYFRSDSGFLTYIKSFDNGVTWDTTPHYSGLMHPESAFTITRDNNNPNTYYALYMNEAQTASQIRGGKPRCRASLAVSYDGMETWEFVSDLVTSNSVPNLPMSDLHGWILGDGQLYWKIDSLDGPGRPQMGVQDLSKVKTVKRLPQLHFRYLLGQEPIAYTAQKHCVISKNDGRAWVYGSYCDADVKDGRMNLGLAESIFGVTAVKSGNSVTLTMGDGKVTFVEGSREYDNNGVKVTAEREVFVNGYLDIKTLSEIYGKNFRETEGSYVILDGAGMVAPYQEGIDGLA